MTKMDNLLRLGKALLAPRIKNRKLTLRERILNMLLLLSLTVTGLALLRFGLDCLSTSRHTLALALAAATFCWTALSYGLFRSGQIKIANWIFLALLTVLSSGMVYLFGFRAAYVIFYVLPVALAALLLRARTSMAVATAAILLYLLVGGAQAKGILPTEQQPSAAMQGVSIALSLWGLSAILRLQLRQSRQNLTGALWRAHEHTRQLSAAYQRNLELVDELEEAARHHQTVLQALQAAIERNKSLTAKQQQFLDDLAHLEAPVIPLRRDLLLVPLVGVVDPASAETLGAAVLEQVGVRQARTVVFDATALALLDAQIAQALIDLMKALRVMGCHSVVTGLAPANARVLARVGLDLELETFQDLQQGLVHLLELDEKVLQQAPLESKWIEELRLPRSV